MGVSGAGKTTLARALAGRFGFDFLEADDHHPPENRARMAASQPLNDADREPWMAAVCAELARRASAGSNCVLAHSALRRAHRRQLRETGFVTLFLFLDGDKSLIGERLGGRRDHYMPASLLDSQFEALQAPRDEPDVVRLDAGRDPQALAGQAADLLRAFLASERAPGSRSSSPNTFV